MAKKKSVLKETPTSKQEKRKQYGISGELVVVVSSSPVIDSDEKTFETPLLLRDSEGNLFVQSSVEVEIRDTLTNKTNKRIVILNSKETKLLLNLLGIVPYVK